jgi:hypothetical protein
VFLALRELWPSSDPRRVNDLDARQVREKSPMLESGYRDHAVKQSIFIGTLARSWAQLDPADRRAHATLIRDRALAGGVAEIMPFDHDHVLQAYWSDGQWRSALGWSP